MTNRLSIIICTKDRPEELERAIASIRTSGPMGRQAEIVVVEESSVPQPLPGVRYIHLTEGCRGFGYARNQGVSEAGGDLLVFMDDDCEAEEGWLEALLKPLMDQKMVVGVAGAVSVRNCGVVGLAENILGFPGGGLRYRHQASGKVTPTKYLSTCNCAYRRSVLLEVGGFQEEAKFGGEDFLLAERVTNLGLCLFVPQAVVYHQTRDRFTKVFWWFIRRGRSESMIARLTNNRIQFATFLVRSSWTIRMLLLVIVMVQWPTVMLMVLPLAGIVYGCIILWRFRFALQYPKFRKAWLIVPLVKLTMDVGSDIGRWMGMWSQVRA